MARRATRPRKVTAWYRGIPYTLDLVRCRRALVECQIAGNFDSTERLADACEISRSTVSRFFSGRPTSLSVTLTILAALGLTFDEVARPASEDDEDGPAPVAPIRPPAPSPGSSGAKRSVV
jgi:transcriptional regulator with XRE-family HTH domain